MEAFQKSGQIGWTKREYIAIQLTASVCSIHNWSGTKKADYQEKVKAALIATDVLIEELNRIESWP